MERSKLIREPIGLRVVVRALRPDDREPFLLWRADPQPEIDRLIEAGEGDDRALLWASLLRWREAKLVAQVLEQAGWTITLQAVRAIALRHAVEEIEPPAAGQGWTIEVGDLLLRAVPERPQQHEASLVQMLSFLQED